MSRAPKPPEPSAEWQAQSAAFHAVAVALRQANEKAWNLHAQRLGIPLPYPDAVDAASSSVNNEWDDLK